MERISSQAAPSRRERTREAKEIKRDGSKLLCATSADALYLLEDPLLSCLVAVDALCLLVGSKLSCLVAADALCLLDGSKLPG